MTLLIVFPVRPRASFLGQWSDGMLPHMVYFTESTTAFPGPGFWQVRQVIGSSSKSSSSSQHIVIRFAWNLRKGGTPDKPITLFAFNEYFPAVATTDVLSRIADVLCCKPSELAFYPVPKLMIRRVGDHEAYSALRASELGDGTLELREVPDALAYINLMEKGPELLINMNECIVKNNQIGLYDGCKNAVLLAQELASSSSSSKPIKSPARASKSPARK